MLLTASGTRGCTASPRPADPTPAPPLSTLPQKSRHLLDSQTCTWPQLTTRLHPDGVREMDPPHTRSFDGAVPPVPPMTEIAFSFTAPSNLQSRSSSRFRSVHVAGRKEANSRYVHQQLWLLFVAPQRRLCWMHTLLPRFEHVLGRTRLQLVQAAHLRSPLMSETSPLPGGDCEPLASGSRSHSGQVDVFVERKGRPALGSSTVMGM